MARVVDHDKKKRSAGWVWGSTVGLKVLMAVTGALLAGFVFAHLLGNLKVYRGREVYNAYAAFLQDLGGLLWLARGTLLVFIVVHIVSALRLGERNRKARKQRYAAGRKYRATNLHALSMLPTGIVALAYIVYHILHFTVGVVHGDFHGLRDPAGRVDLYNIFVLGFRDPTVVTIYVVGNLAIASHLAHAMTSIFHTLGIAVGPFRTPLQYVGPVFGVLVAVGNVSMPIVCLLGLLRPQGVAFS